MTTGRHIGRARKASALLAAACVALLPAACASEDEQPEDGPVTIVVNALPPENDVAQHQQFLDDVAEFEKANPDITVDAREGKMDPQTFPAKLAGGQLEDVFYVYFTDPASLIANKQVADITPYLDEFPVLKQVKPDLMKVFSDADGHVYGVPWTNYSMGLLYNRDLFTQAGLDPNSPPTTWEGVREAAAKIAALGDGVVGYGDYSKSNTGGWHFTAELYSRGGDIAVKDGDSWKAAFNDDKGKAVLQTLYDMRWTDSSMGERQQLEWADLLQMMAADKLGMYVATSDNIPTIVSNFEGQYEKYGLGSMPGGQGTLGGGDGFMFNAKATPAQIRAGLTWLTFKFTNPDRIGLEAKRAVADGRPVGLPEPAIWTGDAAAKQAASDAEHANVPADNYTPFIEGNAGIPLKLEPPQAQQIYAILDTVMVTVLTDRNADIASLLADAETQVNSILAAA